MEKLTDRRPIESSGTLPFSPIRRKIEVKGIRVPGFIRNGSYFFSYIDVFEDGIVDAWGHNDLDFFVKKLNQNWVVPSVPNGEYFSAHNFGQVKVEQGEWLHDRQSYYEWILEQLKSLNPNFHNLYRYHGSNVDTSNRQNARVAKGPEGRGAPVFYSDPASIFHVRNKLYGDAFQALFHDSTGEASLCQISVFKDRKVVIDQIPSPLLGTLDQLRAFVDAGKVKNTAPKGTLCKIHGLGQFVMGEDFEGMRMELLMDEAEDMVRRLNDQPTRSEICREAFAAYEKNPSEENREELKEAYEAVPEHLRRYILGDMDRKDFPIRYALGITN